MGVIKVRYEERAAEELILITKSFLAFVEQQYKNKKITEQEYEGLTGKKVSFIKTMENQFICQ